jgi:subtilisin family serine protease
MMDPLDLVRLSELMAMTTGSAEVVVGLMDGPVALDHPDLAPGRVQPLGATGGCHAADSASCRHGTFVAGILVGRRDGPAPAVAPESTLLVRPIFTEAGSVAEPSTDPRTLAEAIVDCVDAGAWVLNLSASVLGSSAGYERELGEVLDYCLRRGVLVVVAAGNQGALCGSVLTQHPWVIPVVGYSLSGQLLAASNLGRSIGSRGLGAAGEGVVSLTPDGKPTMSAGTSVATPFVTAAAALLWSLYPDASAVDIKHALLPSWPQRRRSLAPPLLDATRAYELLSARGSRRRPHETQQSRSW